MIKCPPLQVLTLPRVLLKDWFYTLINRIRYIPYMVSFELYFGWLSIHTTWYARFQSNSKEYKIQRLTNIYQCPPRLRYITKHAVIIIQRLNGLSEGADNWQ